MDRVSIVNAVKNTYQESIDPKAVQFLAKNAAEAPLFVPKLLEAQLQATVWQILDLKADPVLLLSRAGALTLQSVTGSGTITVSSVGKDITAATVITVVDSQNKFVVHVDKDGLLTFLRLNSQTLQVDARCTLKLPGNEAVVYIADTIVSSNIVVVSLSSIIVIHVDSSMSLRFVLQLAFPAQITGFINAKVINAPLRPVLTAFFKANKDGQDGMSTLAVDLTMLVQQAQERPRSSIGSPLPLIFAPFPSLDTRGGFSIFRGSAAKTEISFATVVDWELFPCYHNNFESSLNSFLIGFECVAVTNSGAEDEAAIRIALRSSLSRLRDRIVELGKSVFIQSIEGNPQIMVEIDAEVEVESLTTWPQDTRGKGANITPLGVHLPEAIPIWDACSLLEAMLPCRHGLFGSAKGSGGLKGWRLRQQLLMEAALVMDLVPILVQAIGERGYRSSGSFLLTNIQDVFEWVLGQQMKESGRSQSLLQSLEALLQQTVTTHILPCLVDRAAFDRRDGGLLSQEQPPAALAMAFRELLILSTATHNLTTALYERKMNSLLDEEYLLSRTDLETVILARDVASHSVVELYLFTRRTALMCEMINLHRLLTMESTFSCGTSGLHANVPSASDVLTRVPLPECLRVDLTMADALLQRLTPQPNSALTSQDLLKLPIDILNAYINGLLVARAYDGLSLQQVRLNVNDVLMHARRVMLYSLLHNIILLHGDAADATNSQWNPFAMSFMSQLASALQIQIVEVELVLALVLIDLGKTVEIAVQYIVLSSAAIALLLDGAANDKELKQSLFFTLVLRLLRTKYPSAGRQLLASLDVYYKHLPFVQSMEVVLALLCTIPEVNEWRLVWQEARGRIAFIPRPSEALQTTIKMTRFISQWCILHGQFALLLQQELTLPEIESVLGFLRDRSAGEIHIGQVLSPTIDALVGFLLKHHRGEEAMMVHNIHVQEVRRHHHHLPAVAEASLKDRETLLAAYESKVMAIPAHDYDMIMNLQRSAQIVNSLRLLSK